MVDHHGGEELVCVAHVHSTYSDGTATVQEIVDAVRASGADVVLLTDHDTLASRRQGWEGWHDGVLVVIGHEVSTRHGHYLAFGLDTEIDHRDSSEADICRAVDRAGGFGFAAHPFSEGSRMSARVGRPHPWSALDEQTCQGIELWSLVTDAAEAWRSPLAALRFLRDPQRWLEPPTADRLARWDELGRARRVPAIGGLDAHQSGLRVRGRVLSPMPHQRYFRLLRTHLLTRARTTGDDRHDVGLVLDALRDGSCFIAVDADADSRGFRFWAEGPAGRVSMGDEAAAEPHLLVASLPRAAHWRLVRDGGTVAEGHGRRVARAASLPGVYRLEAALEACGARRTWVLSNPIYLREG